MIDRLALDESRINGMAKGILDVAKLPSPVGNILDKVKRPNGLIIEKISVPMGVIAIIYESRPNVTSDAASLALKSGNVCILRGGKEAYNSSKAITEALRYGLEKQACPRMRFRWSMIFQEKAQKSSCLPRDTLICLYREVVQVLSAPVSKMRLFLVLKQEQEYATFILTKMQIFKALSIVEMQRQVVLPFVMLQRFVLSIKI